MLGWWVTNRGASAFWNLVPPPHRDHCNLQPRPSTSQDLAPAQTPSLCTPNPNGSLACYVGSSGTLSPETRHTSTPVHHPSTTPNLSLPSPTDGKATMNALPIYCNTCLPSHPRAYHLTLVASRRPRTRIVPRQSTLLF